MNEKGKASLFFSFNLQQISVECVTGQYASRYQIRIVILEFLSEENSKNMNERDKF